MLLLLVTISPGELRVLLGAVVSWGVCVVRQTPIFHVHILLAPPSALGAWSMAAV